MKKIWIKIKQISSSFYTFFIAMPNPVKIVFLVYFLQGIWSNLGHPVTPRLVTNMGISEYYFGYYFAAMSFGMLVGAPIWGSLGDKGNKIYYIVIGLLVYGFGQYMFGFIGDENWMIVFRFISGFGVSASITLLLSHVIEHSDKSKRKAYLGLLQAFMVLGSSIGYYIGGKLPELSFMVKWFHTDDLRYVFLVQAIVLIVHAGYIALLVRDTKKGLQSTRKNIFQNILALRKLDSNFFLFLVSLTFISLGAINVSKYIEVYMNDLGYTPNDIGTFVGATGIVSIVATILIVPLISRLKRDLTFMVGIQVLSAVIIFVVFRSSDLLFVLYRLFMVYVILKAVYTPLEQHFISSYAEEGEYGTVMGVRQSFYAIGLVVGPLLGGYLYYLAPTLVFDISAVTFVIGVFLLLIIGRNIKRKNLYIKE